MQQWPSGLGSACDTGDPCLIPMQTMLFVGEGTLLTLLQLRLQSTKLY